MGEKEMKNDKIFMQSKKEMKKTKNKRGKN